MHYSSPTFGRPADNDRSDPCQIPVAVRDRFRELVRSPLRAALLRYLHSHQAETFDVADLMQTFGRIRFDLENCLQQLVAFGLVRRPPEAPERCAAQQPDTDCVTCLLQDFLATSDERPAMEDTSPSVRRFREMIGRDEKMLLVFESVRTVAKTDLSVLVLGPTGSGKEVVARMIHELSRRRSENLQAVNCAALPDTLFESELFGYEKGAFTGATDRKPGRIELANRGTLFLDEIGDLSPLAQAKLLRVVEEHRVERLGARGAVEVDFRLICATNRPIDAFVSEGKFREDLYYRVNAFAIRLPALKERPTDIPVLAERFLARYCAAQGLPTGAKTFSAEAVERLMSYTWPGNIRELETTVLRAAVSSRGRVVAPAEIEFLHPHAPLVPPAERAIRPLREVELDHIRFVLNAVAWNKKKAAELLRISRETLYRKIAEYQLQPEPRTRSAVPVPRP